ncbi:MAG: adenosyl-hopene transferase HpnH [Planctomycetota bacterium]|nr:MAG: adenosyl-hopene transferase HpnH [Planctomycetota bacterium]
MRFPFSLSRAMSSYMVRCRLRGVRRFPLVLMLEPLHACNLHCAGCGRIREYKDSLKQRLSVGECVAAAEECGAPVVSICGGEPLIYPEIERLVETLIDRGKHIYLCTNGVFMPKFVERFPKSGRFLWNVHLDGMEATHDAITCKPGTFQKAVEGIRAAKEAGMWVTTNTTVYAETDMHEILVLLEYLTELGVDGFLVSPGYAYQAVFEKDADAENLFLSRREIQRKFAMVRKDLERFRLMTSPIYLDFLCGKRELKCAAWANPTRNVRGWKGPCYLITDRHYATFQELMDETDWDALGPEHDARCRDCMVHSGYEPAAVMAAQRSLRDALTMALWQFV